jgi:2-phosphoglycerate kinase
MTEHRYGDPLPLGELLHSRGLIREALATPIVLLIGGATGTGKSAVATEIAHLLGITRVTSTDFIRQTIRAYFPPDAMPAIHYSSFEAAAAGVPAETGDPTLDGFFDQTRSVLVGVEAAVARALAEGWSMVIEGVHLVPGLAPAQIDGAIVVHAVMHIESEEDHRMRFHVRDTLTGGVRAMDRYLSRFDEIRSIQRTIVELAQRTGVPVIESADPDRATDDVLELVLSRAERPRVVPATADAADLG